MKKVNVYCSREVFEQQEKLDDDKIVSVKNNTLD